MDGADHFLAKELAFELFWLHVQAQQLLGIMSWRRAACAQVSLTQLWQLQIVQMRFPDFDDTRYWD